MFGFTKKTDYALVALARLAQQAAEGGDALSARQVAEQFRLPVPLMMNVMKDLQRAGIVASTRGARGGYYLAEPAEQVSLMAVVTAMEGPIKVAACCEEAVADRCLACSLTESCPITGAIQRLHQRVSGFLHEVTLADLIQSEVDVVASRLHRRGEDDGDDPKTQLAAAPSAQRA